MGRLADRLGARARLKRSMYPIRGYVGPNGTGKSAVMVYDALLNLERGRPQLSTVRLLDYKRPRLCEGGPACDDPANHSRQVTRTTLVPFDPDDPTSPLIRHQEPVWDDAGDPVLTVHRQAHPLYVPWRNLGQLLTWRDGDVLADEVTGVSSSRESANMPPEVANFLVQLRRRNVSFSWSTPSWGRADVIIREVSQLVTLMTAALPARAPATPDGLPRLWHRRRLFTARSYDPSMVDEFEAHRAMREEVSPEIIAFYWGPGSTMFQAYDTQDAVLQLANVQSGTCVTCNGRRRQSPCSCADRDHPAPPAGGASRRASAAAPAGPPPGSLPLLEGVS